MILPVPVMHKRIHRELRGLEDATRVSVDALAWIKDLLAPDGIQQVSLLDQGNIAFDAMVTVTNPFIGVPLLAWDVIDAVKTSPFVQAGNAKVRLSAAIALGKNHVQQAIVPFAVVLLHDPDALVRLTAAAALGSLVDASVPAGDRLIAISALVSAAASDLDPQGRVRRQAEAALAKALQFMPALGEAQPAPAPVPDPATFVSTFVPADDRVPSWLTGFADAVKVLGALRSSIPALRLAGVKIAQEREVTAVVPALGMMLLPPVEPDAAVRAAAAEALSTLLSRALPHSIVLAALSNLRLAASTDPDATVREKAATTYQKTKWLRVSKQQIGWAVAGALAGIGVGVFYWSRRRQRHLYLPAHPAQVSW